MSLKILFMGTPNFAVPILKSIHNQVINFRGIYSTTKKKKPRTKN